MTAPTNPPTDGTPGTAVAASPADEPAKLSAAAQVLAEMPAEERAKIMLRRQANIVTAQIAGTNWGKGMDVETAKAVSDWGQRNGIDVTKEIFILGGNIYLNAEFYLNRLATLIERGRVLDWRQSFVNIDPRLNPDDAADRGEIERRRAARIRWSIPDEATSAVVTELELVSMPGVPIYGVKWAPRSASDPIGKAFPQETALTRSARRCLKQAVRYLPEIARYVEGAEEDATATISATLQEAAKRRHEIAEAGAKQLSAGAEHGTIAMPGAEYVDAAAPVTVPIAAPTMPDAYTGDAPAPAAPLAASDPIDDLDLLSPFERAEHEERKRDGRA